LFGPILSTKKGSRYFLDHFVAIEAGDLANPKTATVHLVSPDGVVEFGRFADKLPNNSPLPNAVIGHSRIASSSRGDLSLWRTDQLRANAGAGF
jgi:hypothetical protein